jgi:hypothetical protein
VLLIIHKNNDNNIYNLSDIKKMSLSASTAADEEEVKKIVPQTTSSSKEFLSINFLLAKYKDYEVKMEDSLFKISFLNQIRYKPTF